MKRTSIVGIVALTVLALVLLAPMGADGAELASVKILNKSEWDIHHFYLSPADSNEWGPDQLGEVVLESGSSFTLTDIECDLWDIKVVDEDGDECEIRGVALCDEDAVWRITDDELLACEGWE
ncbi:MAG: hypothetical protein HYU52_13290 [Acidobacteria bacterium]|nr:hypothetical protein [Acidobacteriota bacterium]